MLLQDLRDFFLPVNRVQDASRLLGLCALIGVLIGCSAIGFELIVGFMKYAFLDGLAGYRPLLPPGDTQVWGETNAVFRPWVLALLPAVGGLLGGILIFRFAPEAEGHGTDAVINAFHNEGGWIRARVPTVKAFASALTLGFGGSAGREGPIAQIGAGIAVEVSRRLRLHTRERRILMVAGMAAGIGAIFRAPLAGALFAAEVLYREMDLEFEVIVPAAFSSIAAYSVFTAAFGSTSLFHTTEYSFSDPRELIAYTALALVVAGGAKVYVRTFYRVHGWFRRRQMPPLLRPALGGLGVGLFAFFLPETMGTGYGVVQQALNGNLPLLMLAAIAGGKIITTSLTVGSGQSGGVFGPAVVIGAAIGGVIGEISTQWGWHSPPVGAFVVVGMAGFFAGAANTPLSTVIMVSEMVGNYKLLVPTLWVSTIAFILVRRSTLYGSQVPHRADSLVHRGEMLSQVFEQIRVSDAIEEPEHEPASIVHIKTPARELMRLFDQSHHDVIAVVDDEGRMTGIIEDHDLHHEFAIGKLDDGLTAADIVKEAPVLYPDEDLHSAMRKMVQTKLDELVIVKRDDPNHIVGTLSRRDLIATYDHYTRSRISMVPAPPTET